MGGDSAGLVQQHRPLLDRSSPGLDAEEGGHEAHLRAWG